MSKNTADDPQGRRALLKNGDAGRRCGPRRPDADCQGAEPSPKEQQAQGAVDRATRGMPSPRVKDVRVIQIGGGGVNDSTIVKVETDQAGLYGYGCATNTFPGGRAKLVAAAVERVSEAHRRRTYRRSHRADLADLLHELLLQERRGPQLRHRRGVRCVVGHQGPPGRHAGVPAGGRQVPGSRRYLSARQHGRTGSKSSADRKRAESDPERLPFPAGGDVRQGWCGQHAVRPAQI